VHIANVIAASILSIILLPPIVVLLR